MVISREPKRCKQEFNNKIMEKIMTVNYLESVWNIVKEVTTQSNSSKSEQYGRTNRFP